MKKRRLRKWVKVVLVIIALVLLELCLVKAIENYNDYLVKCDKIKGHTCNVFGK